MNLERKEIIKLGVLLSLVLFLLSYGLVFGRVAFPAPWGLVHTPMETPIGFDFLNLEKSWVLNNDTDPIPPLTPTGIDRAVLIVLDGVSEVKSQHYGIFNELEKKGSRWMDINMTPLTFSLPGAVALMTGVDTSEEHGIISNAVAWDATATSVNVESIFGVAKRAGLRTAMINFIDPHYGNFYADLIKDEQSIDEYVDIYITQNSASDGDDDPLDDGQNNSVKDVVDAVIESLDDDLADLYLVYVQNVDFNGHRKGSDSVAYYNSLKDDEIEFSRLWDYMQYNISGDSLFALTSDHGHVSNGGHGGNTPAVTKIPFLLMDTANKVKKSFKFGTRERSGSIASTISYGLGIAPPRGAINSMPFIDAFQNMSSDGPRKEWYFKTIAEYSINIFYDRCLSFGQNDCIQEKAALISSLESITGTTEEIMVSANALRQLAVTKTWNIYESWKVKRRIIRFIVYLFIGIGSIFFKKNRNKSNTNKQIIEEELLSNDFEEIELNEIKLNNPGDNFSIVKIEDNISKFTLPVLGFPKALSIALVCFVIIEIQFWVAYATGIITYSHSFNGPVLIFSTVLYFHLVTLILLIPFILYIEPKYRKWIQYLSLVEGDKNDYITANHTHIWLSAYCYYCIILILASLPDLIGWGDVFTGYDDHGNLAISTHSLITTTAWIGGAPFAFYIGHFIDKRFFLSKK